MAEEVVFRLRTEGSGQAAGDIGKVSGEFGRLAQSAAETNTATVALAKTLGSSFGSAQKLAQSLGLTATEASKAAARINELRAAGATGAQAFEAISREAGVTQEQFRALSAALKDPFGALDLDGLQNKFGATTAEIEQQAIALRTLEQQAELTGQGYQAIALGGTALAGTIGILGANAIQTGAKFEQLQSALNNAFGGAARGAAEFERIQQFAASTPFQVDQLTASFLRLTNQGFVPTNEELTNLGDLAASQTKEFDQLAEALLDAQQGNFERLQEFGISASKAGDQVTLSFKGLEQTVANTPEAIRGVILGFGELDGIQGSLAAQSATLNGQFSNLQDGLDQAGLAFFQFAQGPAKALLSASNSLLTNFLALPEPVQGLLFTFTGFVGLVAAATAAIAAYNIAVSSGTIPAVIAASQQIVGFGLALQGVTVSSGSAAAGITALRAAFLSAAPAAAAFVTALAPLIVVAAGVAAIDFIRTTKGLEDFNNALEEYQARENNLGQQSIGLAGRLKAANDERNAALERGNQLTAEQEQRNKALISIANEQIRALEQERAAIASLTPENDDQRASQQALIATYDQSIGALQTQIENLGGVAAATAAATAATEAQTEALAEQRRQAGEVIQNRFDDSERAIARQIDDERAVRQELIQARIAALQEAAQERISAQQEANARQLQTVEAAFEEQRQQLREEGQRRINQETEAFDAAADERRRLFQDRQEELQAQETAAFDEQQRLIDNQLRLEELRNTNLLAQNQALDAEEQTIRQRIAIDAAGSPEERRRLEEQFQAENEQLQRRQESELRFADELADIEARRLEQQFQQQQAQAARRAELEAPLEALRDAAAERRRQAETAFNQAEDQRRLEFEQTVLLPIQEQIQAQLEQSRLDFETNVLLPLKAQQEQELKALRLQSEQEIAAAKRAATQEELRLKRQAEDEAIAREREFKQQQRDLDKASAEEIAQILRSAGIQTPTGGAPRQLRRGGDVAAGETVKVHKDELIYFGQPAAVISQRLSRQVQAWQNQAFSPVRAIAHSAQTTDPRLLKAVFGLAKEVSHISSKVQAIGRPQQEIYIQQGAQQSMDQVFALMRAAAKY